MTRRGASLVALVALLAGCGEEAQEKDRRDPKPRAGRPAHDVRYGGLLAHGEVGPPPAGENVDLLSLRLLLHVDPRGRGADVQATLVLGRAAGGARGTIELLLSSEAPAEQVLLAGTSVPFRQENGFLAFELPAGVAGDRQDEVEIYYSLPDAGAKPTGILTPGSAWHPGRGPGDPFAGEIEVFVPEGLGVVATGFALPRESAGPGMVRERFLLSQATGCIGLAWAPGEAVSFEAGGTSFRCLALGPDDLGRVREIAEGLAAFFGPCSCDVVSISGVAPEGHVGTAGPGFTALRAGRATKAAIAHVLAHQWWPGTDGDEALALFAESSLAPPADPSLFDKLFATGGLFAGSETLLSLARRLGELEAERRRVALDRYRGGDRSVAELAAAIDAAGRR
ncbi:MAG: hypothetical protein HY720_14180 [Planctomycetes bacterium]|nr:hypothetical protein [Planctomycetota bacterium]